VAAVHLSRRSASLVPFVAAGLAAAVVLAFDGAAAAVVASAIVLLLFSSWVDLRTRYIPNAFMAAGLAVVLVAAALLPDGQPGAAVAGALIGFGLFLLLNLASRGAVGLGDAKLAAFGGALVGARYLLPALLVGSLSAVLPVAFLLLTHRIGRRDPIAYGPYLAFGFAVVALIGGVTF
jgi:leader peptidase (prepilin peptidase)/N-methyltransferase